MQAGDFQPHLHAQFGIKVGQGFVEQKGYRIAYDGPPDGHALALPAGKCPGLAVQMVLQLQGLRSRPYAPGDLVLGQPLHLQWKTHVLCHRHVRIERVGLEHHREAPVDRFGTGDIPAVDLDLAFRQRFQTGNHPQKGGFAAAGRADKHHHLARPDRQVDAAHRFRRTKPLGHAAQGQVWHHELRFTSLPHRSGPKRRPARSAKR